MTEPRPPRIPDDTVWSAPRPTRIPDRNIDNWPAGQLAPGDVTLYGVILDIETFPDEVQLHCWRRHTVTAAPDAEVTVLGRISERTLDQLRAQDRSAAR